MKWYLAKIIFQIICGEGKHKHLFDEQLRLISAYNENEAFEKAMLIGQKEEDKFYNSKQQLVQWKFINVSELQHLKDLSDGIELYSQINETDDAESYISFVNYKAKSLKSENACTHLANIY